MLNKTKERIAIFFNEKSETKKYEKELRAEENKTHDLTIAEAEHVASRTSYGNIVKSESEQNWRI